MNQEQDVAEALVQELEISADILDRGVDLVRDAGREVPDRLDPVRPPQLLLVGAGAPVVLPEVLFIPLVGFTASGDRLGQGGGYYDRYLAAHPETIAIGMAWDVQEVPELPTELHDMRLSAIVTPTRVLGPF